MKRVNMNTIKGYYVLYDANKQTGFAITLGYAILPPTMFAFKTKALALRCVRYACTSQGIKNPFNEDFLLMAKQFMLVNKYITSAYQVDDYDEFKKGFDAL